MNVRSPLAIPHRPPFLFVDEVIESEPKRIVARKLVDGKSDFFRGHFPGQPVMPGVLICECCFQAGALLMVQKLGKASDPQAMPLLTRITDARFKRVVRPGETIVMEVTLDDELDGAYFFTGRASVEGRQVLRVTFVCMYGRGEEPGS